MTIKTPGLRNPCESSDNLLELFKWLPSVPDEVVRQETTFPPPPLLGQLCFITEEVTKVTKARKTESYMDVMQQQFFKMFGRGTALPYEAHIQTKSEQQGKKQNPFYKMLEHGTATPYTNQHKQSWVF